MTQANFHRFNESLHGVEPCAGQATGSVGAVRRQRPNPVLLTDVGDELYGVEITAADHDLEMQIIDCASLAHIEVMRGNVDAAKTWSDAMTRAIRARRPAVVSAVEKAQLALVDEGVGFFASDAAQAMGRLPG